MKITSRTASFARSLFTYRDIAAGPTHAFPVMDFAKNVINCLDIHDPDCLDIDDAVDASCWLIESKLSDIPRRLSVFVRYLSFMANVQQEYSSIMWSKLEKKE